jgi:hypothetical protein
MTREELMRQVLEDMVSAGALSSEDVANKSTYQAAYDAGLTKQSESTFRGGDTITREETALVLSRGLGDNPEAGTGVDYALGSGLYQGLDQYGTRGTGQEPFYSSYYEGRVGQQFTSLLNQQFGSTGGGPEGYQLTGDNIAQDEKTAEAQRIQDAENALEIIKDKLREYGLEGLADEAYNMLLDGISAEAVILRLRDTEEFAARFPGLDLRRANGFSAISPAEYINLERQYRNVMMTAGIPEGFYDSVDDFAQFIGNDVSQAEMTERVALAATAARSIDPNLRLQLQEMYGVGVENDGELVAYYLDPERGTTVIEQRLQLEAAGLSAASIGALGAGFNTQTAERLVDLNVQAREVSERFRGQRAITQQLVGEDEFTSSEFAAAEFGLDSDATADLARLRALREQRGVRQSGALVTRSGAVGLGTAT